MAPSAAVTATFGPWRRVVDSARAGKPDPEALRDLTNGVLTPDGAAMARPGFRRLAKPATGAAQYVGTVTVNGVDYTYAVVGGRLFQLDWTTETWTWRNPAGVALAATGLVSLVAFAGQVLVSDGANRPWAYDPVANTAQYMGAANTAWYGPLRTHYAKAFGIKSTARQTLLWTEEQDPHLGGEIGGHNDAWDLRQTSDDPLTAIIAEEGRLVYFRPTSAGAILGAVDSEFQANGTFDAVSPRRGTLSPFAVGLTDTGTVWFLDGEGRPARLRAGQGVDELHLACEATVSTVRVDRLAAAWSCYHPDLDVVLFAVPRTAASTANTDLLVFDRASGDYHGRWTLANGVTFATGGVVRDGAGDRRFAFLDADGDVHVQATALEAATTATAQLDQFRTDFPAALPATRVVLPEATAPGGDQAAWVQWTTLVLEAGDPWGASVAPALSTTSTGTSVGYDCETPRETYRGTPRVVTIGPRGKHTVGLRRWGRWLRVALSACSPSAGGGATGSERFRLRRVTLIGQVRDTAPGRR